MSVQFSAFDASATRVGAITTVETACLCAQCAPSWSMYLDRSDRAELASHANAACPFCGGTGIELEKMNALHLDLCNANARALFGILGFDVEDLYGSVSVLRARAAIAHARRTFHARAPGFVREDVAIGGPRASTGNVVELRAPARVHVGGLDLAALEERIDRFESFVDLACEGGAVSISWS